MSEVIGIRATADITDTEFLEFIKPQLVEHVYVKNSNFILYPGQSVQWALNFFALCRMDGSRVIVLGKEDSSIYKHIRINPNYNQIKTLTEMKAYLKDSCTSIIEWVRPAF